MENDKSAPIEQKADLSQLDKFIKWAKREEYCADLYEGQFASERTEHAWLGWDACASAAPQGAPGNVNDLLKAIECLESREFTYSEKSAAGQLLRAALATQGKAAPAPQGAPSDLDKKRFRHACWLLMRHNIVRYLISNADGRWDGAAKAMNHIELCRFVISAYRMRDMDSVNTTDADFQPIREATQALTGYLDEQIGFPLQGQPDYDALAPLFFDKFFDFAIAALATQGKAATQGAPSDLTFDEIEAAFPEGGMMAEHGRTTVDAQWLHDFARNLATQGKAAPPMEAIGKILEWAMTEAVKNGANSISMPDECVEVAAWLQGKAEPAERVAELSDAEIFAIRNDMRYGDGWDGDQWDIALARAIEKRLLSRRPVQDAGDKQ